MSALGVGFGMVKTCKVVVFVAIGIGGRPKVTLSSYFSIVDRIHGWNSATLTNNPGNPSRAQPFLFFKYFYNWQEKNPMPIIWLWNIIIQIKSSLTISNAKKIRWEKLCLTQDGPLHIKIKLVFFFWKPLLIVTSVAYSDSRCL